VYLKRGDVETERFLIEAKTTDNKSFSITTTILNKIKREATKQKKEWLLVTSINGKEVVTLDYALFREMLEMGPWR